MMTQVDQMIDHLKEDHGQFQLTFLKIPSRTSDIQSNERQVGRLSGLLIDLILLFLCESRVLRLFDEKMSDGLHRGRFRVQQDGLLRQAIAQLEQRMQRQRGDVRLGPPLTT